MDEIIINSEALKLLDISEEQYLLLLYYSIKSKEVKQDLTELWEKNFLVKEVEDFSFNTLQSLDVYRALGVSKHLNTMYFNDSIEKAKLLAQYLIDIYPVTNTKISKYNNYIDIAKYIITFKKLYGNYSDNQIKQATKNYISNFNTDFTYLQTLKNFILKANQFGDIESELASYLENMKDESS